MYVHVSVASASSQGFTNPHRDVFHKEAVTCEKQPSSTWTETRRVGKVLRDSQITWVTIVNNMDYGR